jgi:hypothetical protein
LGVRLRRTVFRPDPASPFEVRIDPSDRIPKVPEGTGYSDIHLFDAKKRAIGCLGHVLAEFVSTMADNNQLTESFTKDFPEPTFIRIPGSKRFLRLQSIRAEIRIVKEELPPLKLRPPGFVDFVLQDLETGKQESFIQPNQK